MLGPPEDWRQRIGRMSDAPGISARGLAKFGMFVASLVLALASPAWATPPPNPSGAQVRLLQPSSSFPRARRCLTRLREELEAGGFEVAIDEFGMGGEGLWMVDPPSLRDRSIATIALIGNPDEGAAELWIVNGVPWGRAVVRRLLVPAGAGTRDDEVLAIRALEFLRASALELAGTRTSPPAPSSPLPSSSSPSTTSPSTAGAAAASSAATPTEPDLPQQRAMAVELGVSLMESSSALGPAFLPVARWRAEWLPLFETRLTVAAFGTQPRVTNPKGTAVVGHALALAELRAPFRPGRAVRPAIGVGAGVIRVNVDGTGTFPYEGTGGQRWAGLFDVGAGVTVRLGGRISVAFELHGQLAAPYPTVRFSGEEAARIGRPTLFSSVTLVTPL
jgi:hypothetical protein